MGQMGPIGRPYQTRPFGTCAVCLSGCYTPLL